MLGCDQQIARRISWRQVVAGIAAQVIPRLGLRDEQSFEIGSRQGTAQARESLRVAHAVWAVGAIFVFFLAVALARLVVALPFARAFEVAADFAPAFVA